MRGSFVATVLNPLRQWIWTIGQCGSRRLVADPSKALIPGVTVTATNTGTGVAAMTVTNESGAYNFPALQPGNYKVSAGLPGFQTQTFTAVQLGGGQQVTLNFTLQVAAAAGQENVEVTVAADTILATTSNWIGTVLPEYKIRDMPKFPGNVLNLVQNTRGVQRDASGTFGYMAGGRLGDVNATRDGINVNDGRYKNGAWSTIYTSPDMVEEVEVVVAPVDAETSRGDGQVSMVTRSGTNQYEAASPGATTTLRLTETTGSTTSTESVRATIIAICSAPRWAARSSKTKTSSFCCSAASATSRTQATGLTWTDIAKAGIFRTIPTVKITRMPAATVGLFWLT